MRSAAAGWHRIRSVTGRIHRSTLAVRPTQATPGVAMLLRSKRLAGPRPAASGALVALVALALVACCDPARAGSDCAGHAPAAALPALPVAPFDPATFVGPPVPLGILFAPATPPATGGLRYEPAGSDAPAPATANAAALRPAIGPGVRMVWDPEIQSQLREVPAPGGGYMVDLLGAYLDFATITIGPDGRPVLGCAQHPDAALAAARRARIRAGRE